MSIPYRRCGLFVGLIASLGFMPGALAIELTSGAVNTTLDLGAGVQTAHIDDSAAGPTSSDSEFSWMAIFNAERVMDSGRVFGLRLEIDDGGRQVEDLARDELYVYFSGEFGRVELGEQDGAADVLSLRAPLVGLGQVRGDFARYSGSAALLSPYDTSDALKVVYLSAPLHGLRAGISYAPKVSRNVSDPNPMARFIQRDGLEFGAQYQLPVGEWSTGLSLSHVRAKADAITTRRDIDSWSIGWQARRDTFVLGGAYVDRGDSDRLSDTQQKEYSLGVALRHERWSAGVSYARSRSLQSRLETLGAGATHRFLKNHVELRLDVVGQLERRPAQPRVERLVLLAEVAVQL